jgi:predicted NBD/HSP70 family sugar kinase
MDKHTLAASIRIGMFAERETIQEAFDYADQVFKSLGAADIAARTAMHVVLNTVAKQIAALPAEIVGTLPADNPAAGVTSFEDTLIKLIDSRIAQRGPMNVGDQVNEVIDDFAENRLDDLIERWVDRNLDWNDIVRDELINNISFSISVD